MKRRRRFNEDFAGDSRGTGYVAIAGLWLVVLGILWLVKLLFVPALPL